MLELRVFKKTKYRNSLQLTLGSEPLDHLFSLEYDGSVLDGSILGKIDQDVRTEAVLCPN